jgi:beta-catenin-like protein 1
MNVDKLFNIPSSSIPSGKNKRKLTANPNIEVLKAVRQKTNPEEIEEAASDFVTGNANFKTPQPVSSKSALATPSSSKGKGKAVQISDEVEEQEYYIDDYDDEYESGLEEEEGGRFYGGGLTEEQKRILDLVDQVDVEEVCI